MKTKGKIIAVVGPQAAGKSTLVYKLVENNPAWKAFYEGESFPEFVTNAFSDPDKRILAFLYFHNKWVKQYIEAQRLREQGNVVILDNYWLSNLFFIETLIDTNEKELIKSLIENASRLFRPPDGIIYLEVAVEAMIKRISERKREGGRFWENTQEWLPEPLNVRNEYINFFESPASSPMFSETTEILKIDSMDKDLLDHSVKFINQIDISVPLIVFNEP